MIPIAKQDHAVRCLLDVCNGHAYSMFEKAAAMQELCTRHDFTQNSLAKALKISQSAVGNKIRLLQFSHAEREQILALQLTERHARTILRADAAKRARLIQTVGKLRLTVQQTEEWIDKQTAFAAQSSQSAISADLLFTAEGFVEQTLRSAERLRNTGRRVSCLTESGKDWQRIIVTIYE